MKKLYFKYIVSLLLFGSNGIVASKISLTSYEIVLLRTCIGSILLFAIFIGTKGKFTFMKYKGESCFLVLSGIAMGSSWIFLYEAYQQIGVSMASLLYYCGPVIVMAVSPILFKEPLTVVKVGGFIVVLMGILLINGQILTEQNNAFGIVCGCMSAVLYAWMVIFNKKTSHIQGMENASIQLFVSFLTVAIFVGGKQGYHIHISTEEWIPILILGLINTGIGCYFYFSSIGLLPIQTVAICGYLEPLSAVIFACILLRENMNGVQVLGAILIIGGAIVSECKS